MRIPVLFLPLLLLFGSCSLFSSDSTSEFAQPNSLMADEIENRVQQIPFQHRDELLQNLLWLTQTGETTIPSLLRGLKHESPKVRSSCAWALGRIHDRRSIPFLQTAVKDSNDTVRLEVARSLVMLGDLKNAPTLIEGLDSDKKEVRYLCHEALKASTGRDFGFDHLSDNETQRRVAVLGWRQWWGEYSGDPFFANSYAQRYQIGQPAQPMGETQPNQDLLPLDPMEQPAGQDPAGRDPMDGSPTDPAGTDDGIEVVPAPQPGQDGGAPVGDPWPGQPQPAPNGQDGQQPRPGTEPMPLPGRGDGKRRIGR